MKMFERTKTLLEKTKCEYEQDTPLTFGRAKDLQEDFNDIQALLKHLENEEKMLALVEKGYVFSVFDDAGVVLRVTHKSKELVETVDYYEGSTYPEALGKAIRKIEGGKK